MQRAIFDVTLPQQLNPAAIVGMVRGRLLRRDIRRRDIRAVVHFQLLAFNQSRCCRAGAVPVAKMQSHVLEAGPEIAHHPRQEPQFLGRVGFDLPDILVGCGFR